jgi:cobalt transporter subunit CbtB
MTAARLATTFAFDRRTVAGLLSLLFGVGLLAAVGFAGPQAIHNAAHDTRHAIGFPCH